MHWLPAEDMQKRFSASLKARLAAGRVQPDRRGVWIPLYYREEDNRENVSFVGGGAGLDYPAIARVPMNGGDGISPDSGDAPPVSGGSAPPPSARGNNSEGGEGRNPDSLSIAEAKRRLAVTLGVPESSIKIIVEA